MRSRCKTLLHIIFVPTRISTGLLGWRSSESLFTKKTSVEPSIHFHYRKNEQRVATIALHFKRNFIQYADFWDN